MKFIFFSFDGAIFPVAYKLQQEGQEVYVCQVVDGDALGVKTWISDKEAPENRKRRLSLYDGLLDKKTLPNIWEFMRKQIDKEQFFVFFDHSNFCKLAERALKMGYTNGLFPTTYDFEMEEDRKKAKNFVKKHYPDIKLAEVHTFKSVDDTIAFIEETDKLWVIKSDGNFGDTLVPDTDDIDMAKRQIIHDLTEDKKDYEKGSIIAEEKIMDPIEFNVEIAFYNGNPIYTQIEIETRMLGCLDIGPQTGGNQNLLIRTAFSDEINKVCFPPIVYEEARERKGLYLRDAGLLSDGEDLYFTEFAGNRYGWGGIFSEMSASMNGKEIVDYFIKIRNGENPYRYKYATTLSLYVLEADPKHPGLPQGDISFSIKEGHEHNFFLSQVKQNKTKDGMVTVGYRCFGNSPMGYVTGRGDTLEGAIDDLYEHLKGFSLREVYYRPKSDFLSLETNKCVIKRLQFLRDKGLING
jgi:phosphoribosylamine-glycine ligase